jgi:signal transduction protein with GAF and PtsI domain
MQAAETTAILLEANQLLSDVTSDLAGHFDMPGLLNQVVTTSMTALRAEVCSIFLIEREGDKDIVVMRAGSGFAKRVVDKAKYELGEGLTGHVALQRKNYNFRSREELEHLQENGKRIWKGKHDKGQWESEKSEFRNGIVLPLLIRKRCLGVIKVENKVPADGGPFSEHDELYLKTIANVVALAIENAKLHKRTDDVMSSITGALKVSSICNACWTRSSPPQWKRSRPKSARFF